MGNSLYFKFSTLESVPQVKFLGNSLCLSSGNRRAQNFILWWGIATLLPLHTPLPPTEDAPIEIVTEMESPQEIVKAGNTDVKKHIVSTLTILQTQLSLFPGTLNSCEGVSDWFFGCYHCTDRQGDPNLGTGILKSLYRFEASHLGPSSPSWAFEPFLCDSKIQSYRYLVCCWQFSALTSPCSCGQSFLPDLGAVLPSFTLGQGSDKHFKYKA